MKSIHTFVVLAYKESKYLDDCIKSVLNQKFNSEVVIATSTPNKFIDNMAKKYKLNVIFNDRKNGIGRDFDFAVQSGRTTLVTVAHQDDIYDYEYSYKIVEMYEKNNNSSIYFTDYYEIKGTKKVHHNINLFIKRILLIPLRVFGKTKFGRRLSLSFGSSICCPAVTFNKKYIKFPLFECDFKCDVDWYAWEILSKQKQSFSFSSKKLMGHRVHEESTTTGIIKENTRTKEDYIMFKKFWPKWFAKTINKIYSLSEKNNG